MLSLLPKLEITNNEGCSSQLSAIRAVYYSVSHIKCYKFGFEYYSCSNKKWELIKEAVSYKPDHYEIRGRFFIIDKKTKLVTPKKVEVIRIKKTLKEANDLYDKLKEESDLLEKNFEVTKNIYGLKGWLPSICNCHCIKDFQQSFIEQTYYAILRICGANSEIGSSIRYLTFNLLENLRNFDKISFENPQLPILPDSGKRLTNVEIRKVLRCAEKIFEAAQSLALIPPIQPKFTYKPLYTKEKRKEPDFNEHAKSLLIGGIVRRVEFFRGKPWDEESYRDRLFVLVTAMKIWKPDRFPMVINAVLSRVCIEEPILLNSTWAQEQNAQIIYLNILLPHTDRNVSKGYSATLIPPPLEDLFKGLYDFKQGIAKKIGGNRDLLIFSRSSNGLKIEDLKGKTISNFFNERTFRKWFKRFQKEEGIPEISRID
jgi:hypothetical protein